jgi:cyclopropane fatty-acyl-phospholipid synthase-like methyltransferase
MPQEVSQITSGIRSALSLPRIYNIFQSLIRKNHSTNYFVSQYLKPAPNERVLDVGCGTGRYLEFMPNDVDYTGVDLSSQYIEFAKNKYKSRGTFICGDVSQMPNLKGAFDLVYATGLLHHISDENAVKLFQSVQPLLSPNGRFITLDPTFIDNQSPIARFIIKQDRGQHVRHSSMYVELAKKIFNNVESEILNDFLRIPYNHIIMQMRN